jgi:hypothetical protein
LKRKAWVFLSQVVPRIHEKNKQRGIEGQGILPFTCPFSSSSLHPQQTGEPAIEGEASFNIVYCDASSAKAVSLKEIAICKLKGE